jgi:GNAT superfamily N-acetyltransferase
MYSAVRLHSHHFHDLVAHFLRLTAAQRAARFGRAMSDAAIIDYVSAIDFASEAVFGVVDPVLDVAGAAHLRCDGDAAALGLSVLPAARNLGLGHVLLRRACAFAQSINLPIERVRSTSPGLWEVDERPSSGVAVLWCPAPFSRAPEDDGGVLPNERWNWPARRVVEVV